MEKEKGKKEVYCRAKEKELMNFVYSKNRRIAELERAIDKILQKFKEPLYNGNAMQYETIEEIAARAIRGRRKPRIIN